MKAITTILLSVTYYFSFGQCDNRYFDPIFDSVTTTTVEYSSVYNLDVDIFQPVGDTFSERPLIIFAHGGAFYTGNKESGTMVSLCTDFARRGYVTASIQYRLAGSLFDLLDSTVAIDIVVKAVSDGKASIRFFRDSHANGNPYGIDPNQIYSGGNSAGGVLFAHAAVVDSSEVSGYVETAFNNNGGIEGNSGNPGYNSQVKAVVNLAGAINQKAWIDSSDPAIVSCHGTLDATVPYNCGDPLTSITQGLVDVVDLCGGGKMQERIDQVGGVGALRTFWESDHVPWSVIAEDYDLMFEFVRDFLYQSLDCSGGQITLKSDTVNYVKDTLTSITGIESIETTIYPNPASGNINIELANQEDVEIAIVNLSGQLMLKEVIIGSHELDVSTLAEGIYIIEVKSGSKKMFHKISIVR
ncbi:MAG: T9SS type A sorting domain-containing protein [Chitinophagales bacterium]|nr:T9SS type A sorting domain-containing protein [Chitinophagales bacterium]